MLAFSTGYAASASTTAFSTNGTYVSRTPRSSNEALCLWRRWSIREKSISNTVETWAEMRLESTMCSAVFLRIGDLGTIWTRGPATGAGAAGAGGAGAGAEGAAAGADGAAAG